QVLEFFYEYGAFLARAATVVVAILVVLAGIAGLSGRSRRQSHQGHVEIRSLNDKLKGMRRALESAILPKDVYKRRQKQEKQARKAEAKQQKKLAKQAEPMEDEQRRRLFVLDFEGDIRASRVDSLRDAVTAVLGIARENDEVVVRLESPGGMVHSYGLAASQLQRIKDRGVPLTVCVDKVAASGGYMMACIADRILAAPFAVI